MAKKKALSEKKVEVETKTTPKAEQPKQTKRTESCGKCCITSVVIILVICCAVSYFVYEKAQRNCADIIERKMHDCCKTSNSELASLKNAIADLKKDLEACKAVKQVQHDNAKLRTKWKAWTALKDKMEAGEAIDEELKRVKEVFADDAELLQKIDDLLGDAEKNANMIPQNIRKYVDKFVTLKRADSKKVAEVTGYVLSSPCNGE